jgi:predicted nuclease of predicted toxin-antitoxin system
MTWKTLNRPYDRAGEVSTYFRKAARFLVDGRLGREQSRLFRELGYDAVDVFMLRLAGVSDEQVFQAACREHWTLVTGSRVFLNDSRFPPEQNAGILLLPRANDILTKALLRTLCLLWGGSGFWTGSKIVAGEDGRLTISVRSDRNGAWETKRYKLRVNGPPLIWMGSKFT